jgi:hypothetical protein
MAGCSNKECVQLWCCEDLPPQMCAVVPANRRLVWTPTAFTRRSHMLLLRTHLQHHSEPQTAQASQPHDAQEKRTTHAVSGITTIAKTLLPHLGIAAGVVLCTRTKPTCTGGVRCRAMPGLCPLLDQREVIEHPYRCTTKVTLQTAATQLILETSCTTAPNPAALCC